MMVELHVHDLWLKFPRPILIIIVFEILAKVNMHGLNIQNIDVGTSVHAVYDFH